MQPANGPHPSYSKEHYPYLHYFFLRNLKPMILNRAVGSFVVVAWRVGGEGKKCPDVCCTVSLVGQ